MTNETHDMHSIQINPSSFGGRLKSAREAMGLERKDTAAQLRLNERVIIALETEQYPADLPVTFIRGYIRAYAKLLQIPEHEVAKALEPIKPKPVQTELAPAGVSMQPETMTSGNYFMQFFTYLIGLTLISLVGTWWYNHRSTPSSDNVTEASALQNPSILQPVAISSESNTLSSNAALPLPPGQSIATNPDGTNLAAAVPPTIGSPSNSNHQLPSANSPQNSADSNPTIASSQSISAPKKPAHALTSSRRDESDDDDDDNYQD